jgi:hypothetical protein
MTFDDHDGGVRKEGHLRRDAAEEASTELEQCSGDLIGLS